MTMPIDRMPQDDAGGLVLLPDAVEAVRQAADHAGEDDHAHAVADAALADQLAEPHQQGGAGDERDDHQVAARPHPVGEQLDALGDALGGAEERVAATLTEDERQRRGLHHGDADAEIAGVLGDLALPDRAFLLQLLELGDDHPEHLHDDARRDVRHDPEREDREAAERAAAEQVEEAERALLLDALLELLDRLRVDARHPDGDAQSVQGDDQQEEQELVPQIADLEDVLDVRQQALLSW